MLIVFHDLVADTTIQFGNNNKKSPIVTDLFLRARKLTILLVFISPFYFKLPKTMRLNATHYFIMKIPNKNELQQIVSNNLSDINFKHFIKLNRKYNKEPHSFLVNNIQLYHQKIHYDLEITHHRNEY